MSKFITCILLLSIIHCRAQNVRISGKINDISTGLAIQSAHVYLNNNHKSGTITNADGAFSLWIQNKSDTLIVSHIGYQTLTFSISSLPAGPINQKLTPNIRNLDEVVIRAMSATQIMEHVLKNLKLNHEVEPVCYNFFTRIYDINTTDSSLNFLEEHVGKIYQTESHKTMFEIEKTRIKAFSSSGEEYLKKYRMIGMGEAYTDNMFKYLEGFLNKRKIKTYTFDYMDDVEINNRQVYVIKYYSEKDKFQKAGILYVDKETFGIIKKLMYGGMEYDSENFKDITFSIVDNKWYLQYTDYPRHLFGDEYEFVLTRRQTLYNITDLPKNLDSFKGALSLSPKFIKSYEGDFNDDFWGEQNYIPLSNWISIQINEKSNIKEFKNRQQEF